MIPKHREQCVAHGKQYTNLNQDPYHHNHRNHPTLKINQPKQNKLIYRQFSSLGVKHLKVKVIEMYAYGYLKGENCHYSGKILS